MSHKKRQDLKKRKREQANRKQYMWRASRSQSSKAAAPKRLVFFPTDAPFASLPMDEALKAFQEMGQAWAVQFDEQIPKLESLIRQVNPLALLAMACTTTLMRPLDGLAESVDEGQYFLSHLELLQAFILREPPNAFSSAFVESQHLTAVMNCVRGLGKAFAFKRIAQVSPETSQEQRGAMAISEQFRVHTQDVRNDGYIGQMHRLYKELLAPLDADFVSTLGVTAQGIVDCFFRTHGIFSDRFNKHLQKCEPAMNAATPEEAVRKYAEAYGLTTDEHALLIDFVSRSKLAGEDLRAYLIWQTFNGIHRLFVWSIDDWLPLFGEGTTEDAVATLVDRLSLDMGDLSESDPEHFFMGNPVWVQPLMPIDESRFFLACPGTPLSHCLEIIAFLIEDDAKLKEKYLKRRGDFLEDELAKLIMKVLPDADIFQGTLWKADDTTEGENDLLAVINGVGLVFEAKAGTIHASAKRGATLRLQNTVGKIVVDASAQAHGFINFLQEAKGPLSLPSSKGGLNHIDPSRIDTFVPIAVSLDQLASEFLCWSMLVKTKTVPADAKPVVATSIWDLELVTEILDEEYLLLHYLSRRYNVEQRATYFGDELDLLVLYLDTGFDIPERTADSPLQLGRLSNQLNPYFMGKEEGVKTVKPARQLTPWWRNIVTALWRKQTRASRESAFAMLDVSIQQQEEIGREFDKVKRRVQSNSNGASIQDCLLFETGSGEHRYCVVLMAVGDALFAKPKDELHDYMAATARQALAESRTCEYTMVFAVHADLQTLPYSAFVLIHRDAWNATSERPVVSD